MNFEKSNNPLKNIDIGQVAIPTEIMGMYTLDNKEPRGKNSVANMSDKDCRRILEGIEKGELGIGWENRYYVGALLADQPEPTDGSLKSLTFKIMPMSTYIGGYIKFQRVKYFIPKL